MKAMILAAGRGQRMLPLTNNVPKPLVKLNNKFLIEYAIEALKAAGIKEIIINIHHLKEKIKNNLKDGKKWQVNIKYSEEQELLDTGGGILQAIKSNLIGQEPFVIISSDIVTNYDIKQLLPKLSKSTLAHLILVPNPNFKPQGDFSLHNHYINVPFSIKNQPNMQATNNKNFTYANIGVFHPKFFEDIDKNEKIFPLINLINKHINNQTITGEVYNGWWQNVGNLKDLDKINQMFKQSDRCNLNE